MPLIVILGMHRSGTSATAGLITHLDYFPGHQLLPENEFNKKGYFESQPLVAHNDDLLRHFNLNCWHDIRCEKNLTEIGEYDFLQEKAKNFFLAEYEGQEKKIFKDPRVCRTLPFWKKVFSELGENPQYVFTLRKPTEVIASLSRRDNMPANHSALLYAIYLLDAEKHSRGEIRALVRYNELLTSTKQTLSELDSHLGTSFSSTDPTVLAEACGFLDPSLNHKPEAPIFFPDSPFIDFADEVFDAFDQHFYNASPAIFDQLRDKLDALRSMLEPWLSKAARTDALESEIFVPDHASYEAASQNAHATVYWKTPSLDYLESRSIAQPFHFGADTQVLQFPLPATPDRVLSLRLDLTDRPAFCEAFALSLNDTNGCMRWVANGVHSFVNVSGDMHIFCDEGGESSFTFIATGFDPYAELAIPESILSEVREGWLLIAKATFRLQTESWRNLVERFQLSTRKTEDERQAREESVAEVESLKKSLAQKNTELQTQASNLESLRTQLLRAEAQLELLKDLMISGSDLDRL